MDEENTWEHIDMREKEEWYIEAVHEWGRNVHIIYQQKSQKMLEGILDDNRLKIMAKEKITTREKICHHKIKYKKQIYLHWYEKKFETIVLILEEITKIERGSIFVQVEETTLLAMKKRPS